MSIGPSFLVIHERSNGDIGLALPNQSENMYVLNTRTKSGSNRVRCIQDVVRCRDNAILATVMWINPKKDLVKIEDVAYTTIDQWGNSWTRLDDAWKAAAPIKGDW
jgi:hypothetical protein